MLTWPSRPVLSLHEEQQQLSFHPSPLLSCQQLPSSTPPPPTTVDGCNINEHILAGLLVKLRANPVILKRPRPRRSSVPVDIALFTKCQQDGAAVGGVRGPSLG